MASHAPPALCSTPAYKPYLPLAGFPPAQGWCSTVSLPSSQDGQDASPCQGSGELCALLAELKEGAEGGFARGVWYGVLFSSFFFAFGYWFGMEEGKRRSR